MLGLKNTDKKNVIVCNTLFQIIIAAHLRLTVLRGEFVDIIVSNHTKNSRDITKNIEKLNLFDNVIFIKNKKTLQKGNGVLSKISYGIKRVFETLNNIVVVNKICRKNNYDCLLINNISIFTMLFYKKLLSKNKNTELCLFEEGLGTYSNAYTNADKPNSLHRKLINRTGIIANFNKLYLMFPDLLEWSAPNAEIVQLPKINVNDSRFVSTINIIFDIKEIKDKYDKPIIFFEESHFTDGFAVSDIDLVNQIADIVGKENIMIKLHPRTSVNRFKTLGYKTNSDTNIPWEVVALNQDLANKTLITISSGSVLSPFLYFGIDIKSISILNCLTEKPGYMKGELGEFMNKIYAKYPDVFYAPQNLNELKKHLKI